jgi:hypothetical protein
MIMFGAVLSLMAVAPAMLRVVPCAPSCCLEAVNGYDDPAGFVHRLS